MMATTLLNLNIDLTKPLEAQRVLAERKAQAAKDDVRCVGTVYPRPDDFVQPMEPLAPLIRKIAEERKIEAIDLSAPLLPRMTIAQVWKWKSLLMKKIEMKPQTIFYVTVDNISPTEAILAFDAEIKKCAMTSGVAFQSYAQAILWRGEDWVRVAGLRNDMTSLKQQMRPLTDPDDECALCLEKITDAMSAVTAGSEFACGHMICKTCGPSLQACPICREAKPMLRRRGERKPMHR